LNILTGKLVGSVVVGIAGAIAALVGMNFYTSSVMSFASEGSTAIDLEALGLGLTPTAYLLLGIVMFVTIVSGLALAICVASFAENVRSAQSMVGSLNIIIILPSIMLMFADIDMLPAPVQFALYAIPYTHSIIAGKAALMGDYFTILVGLIYISLFTVAVLYVTARVFATEIIISSRFSFRKAKPRK
jgi:ABC-2 type transport system permease protein